MSPKWALQGEILLSVRNNLIISQSLTKQGFFFYHNLPKFIKITLFLRFSI